MGIRVQPRDLDIPEKEPFKHDLLDREESVEILTSILGSIDGPCVLAVDAPWGTGKTTFLKMLVQSLRDQAFTVVAFNAWETDFSEDPFVALSSEITDGLKGSRRRLSALKRASSELVRAMQPWLSVGASAIPHAGPPIAAVLEQLLANKAEKSQSDYTAGKKAIQKFKRALGGVAASLAKAREGRSLVVVIDELYRCRPSYAVALLEVAKHLFSVDQIIFVLAVDRSQLTHSIKVLYGQEFDAEGYLRRFFDVDYRLPDPDRKKYIKAMLSATGFIEYFDQTRGHDLNDAHLARNLLDDFFSNAHLSLRDVAQAIHRLGLVLASLPKSRRAFIITSVVLLVMRTVRPDLYRQFIRGEITDIDVVDGTFESEGIGTLRYTNSGNPFEALLILAKQEMVYGDGALLDYPDARNASPLRQRYDNVSKAQHPNGEDEELHKQAQSILARVDGLQKSFAARGLWTLGVNQTIQRIELLSPELKEDNSARAEP